MLIGLLALCVSCKKENDDTGGNNNNSSAVAYTLSIKGDSGYFFTNPINATYDPDNASDVFYGALQSQGGGTNVRARHSGNVLVDMMIHFNGGIGSGNKAIVYHPTVPQSDLFLIANNGNFTLVVKLPENTPISITGYGAVNNLIDGEVSGTFNHKEIISSPSSTTEYSAPIHIKFKVKRSQ